MPCYKHDLGLSGIGRLYASSYFKYRVCTTGIRIKSSDSTKKYTYCWYQLTDILPEMYRQKFLNLFFLLWKYFYWKFSWKIKTQLLISLNELGIGSSSLVSHDWNCRGYRHDKIDVTFSQYIFKLATKTWTWKSWNRVHPSNQRTADEFTGLLQFAWN